MPRKATTMALSLTEEARSTLAVLARSRTAPTHHVERSAIILHLAAHRDASEIGSPWHRPPAGHPMRPPGDGRGTAQGHR
jgi:hypothetical protein